jgi:uncharacterized sulfatase
MNKGLPYETSAKIPFVIRYPARIKPGKVIQTAQTNVDFTPTVLGLLDLKHDLPEFHGKNTAADLLSDEKKIVNDRIVYFRNAGGAWVAAVDHRYKLVLSTSDTPWLFDLEKDPNELTNCFEDPAYQQIGSRFKAQLLDRMKKFNEPAMVELTWNDSKE